MLLCHVNSQSLGLISFGVECPGEHRDERLSEVSRWVLSAKP